MLFPNLFQLHFQIGREEKRGGCGPRALRNFLNIWFTFRMEIWHCAGDPLPFPAESESNNFVNSKMLKSAPAYSLLSYSAAGERRRRASSLSQPS